MRENAAADRRPVCERKNSICWCRSEVRSVPLALGRTNRLRPYEVCGRSVLHFRKIQRFAQKLLFIFVYSDHLTLRENRLVRPLSAGQLYHIWPQLSRVFLKKFCTKKSLSNESDLVNLTNFYFYIFRHIVQNKAVISDKFANSIVLP